MNNITLALQVIGKIFSGMFLTGEGLAITILFIAAAIALWSKYEIES